MRLQRLAAVALAMAMTTLLTAAPASAVSPLNWPEGEDEPAMARHCLAVLSAFGDAYDLAIELAGREAAHSVQDLPIELVQLAGGDGQRDLIAAQAEGFRLHAESVARTSFYPRLVGDGTPYLADDGRDLMIAVHTCTDRFGL